MIMWHEQKMGCFDAFLHSDHARSCGVAIAGLHKKAGVIRLSGASSEGSQTVKHNKEILCIIRRSLPFRIRL